MELKKINPSSKSKSKKDRLAQKKVAIALDEDLARFNALSIEWESTV
jgi:hypothetical protein